MRIISSLAALAALGLGLVHASDALAANQWESEIVAYETADSANPPPKGAIVVTGSSSIRLWSTISSDLAPLSLISRGFGGSTAADLDYYLERMVLVYEPRAVVIYEGDNDTAFGTTPQQVADTMAGILARISARLPSARVYVLSIKPAPARWSYWTVVQQANQLLLALCRTDARYTYIDSSSVLLDSNGQPRTTYYQADQEHLSAAGYAAWTSVIRPVLIAQQSVPLPTDTAAPTVPTGLSATAVTESRIDLRWTASTDAGSGLAGYQLVRNGVSAGTTTRTNWSDSALAANTSYTYNVRAYDRVTPNRNESVNSTPASATTLPGAPPPPPTVTLTATPTAVASGSTTLLAWDSSNATTCTAAGGWAGAKATNGSAASAALNNDTTFSLSCTGAGGTTSQSVSVTIIPPPTVTLAANPSTVPNGATTQLTWSTTGANACTASGAWSGAKPTSGSATSAALTSSTSFTLACTGAGGAATASAAVTVLPPVPTVTLSASPASVAGGSSTQLAWSSTNATSCTASDGWSGAKPTSGSATSGALTITTSFSLSCTGGGGTASQSVLVTIIPPPTVALAASPMTIANGATTQLTWSTTGATTCAASGAWSGAKTASGSATSVALASSTSFTLTCSGPGGSATASAAVNVLPPVVPVPPAPPVTPVPTVTLSAAPTSIANGATSQLSWSSTNATACTAAGGWIGSRPPSGSETTAALTTGASFDLSCTGPGGTASASAAVAVAAALSPPPPPPPLPKVTLSASPETVASGASAQLTWNASDASTCTASGGWSASKPVSGSEQTQSLSQAATYNLTCTGPGGSADVSVVVKVSAAAPAPSQTVTVTASSGGGGGGGGALEWQQLLVLLGPLLWRQRAWSATSQASRPRR
jgi:lysophospholipase L1-like esterase